MASCGACDYNLVGWDVGNYYIAGHDGDDNVASDAGIAISRVVRSVTTT